MKELTLKQKLSLIESFERSTGNIIVAHLCILTLKAALENLEENCLTYIRVYNSNSREKGAITHVGVKEIEVQSNCPSLKEIMDVDNNPIPQDVFGRMINGFDAVRYTIRTYYELDLEVLDATKVGFTIHFKSLKREVDYSDEEIG